MDTGFFNYGIAEISYISTLLRSPKKFLYAFHILNRDPSFLPVIISPETLPRPIISKCNRQTILIPKLSFRSNLNRDKSELIPLLTQYCQSSRIYLFSLPLVIHIEPKVLIQECFNFWVTNPLVTFDIIIRP